MKKFAIVVALCIGLTGCWDTGTGEKIGGVVKMAKQGVFCKTWEGQLIRGGFNAGTGAQGTAFDFTVEDDQMAQDLIFVMESRQEIQLKYRSELGTWCRSDTPGNHFVVSYTVLGQPEAAPNPGIPIKRISKQSPAELVPMPDDRSGQTTDSDAKIQRLLETQAQLIAELAKRK